MYFVRVPPFGLPVKDVVPMPRHLGHLPSSMIVSIQSFFFVIAQKQQGKKGVRLAPAPRQSEKHLTLILERDSLGIRCFSRVVATFLRRFAVRVPHAEACFAALRHEETEPNVTALTASITLGGVLVNAVL